ANSGESMLKLAGGVVKCGGQGTEFVEGLVFDSGSQISFSDARGDLYDAPQTAGNPYGGCGGQQEGHGHSQRRGLQQSVTNLGVNGLDVGEGIGQANGSARDRSSDIEKRNSQRGVAALAAANPAG